MTATSAPAAPEGNLLRSLITSITAGDLLDRKGAVFKEMTYYSTPPSPIQLDQEMTLKDACMVLIKNRISSAPIVDGKGSMIGILDFKDLVAHVLQVLNDVPIDVSSSIYGMSDILAQHSDATGLLKNLKHLTKPLVSVKKDAIILDILEDMIRSNVHRVVVLGDNKEFLGVVSQSTIAAFIVGKFGLRKAKSDPFWPKGQESIAEAGVIERNIISCEPKATVMEALFIMHGENVSSVAILGPSGQLAGNLSLCNVKHVLCDKSGWKKVFERCDDFFKSDRVEQSNERQGKAVSPNFTVHETCSVIHALEKIVATRAHRVWVVDDEERCVGLVSLSTMIKLLLQ